MPDGNDVAVRAIAQTLFDTWKAEQEIDQKRRVFGGSIPAWVACGLSIVGIVMLAGGTNQKVNDNIRRIDTLEASDREQNREATTTAAKLSTIEGKLDILINQRLGGRQRESAE